MTIQGTVSNGVVVLDQAGILPEGARVEVNLRTAESCRPTSRNGILVMQVPQGTPAIDADRVGRQLEEDGF